KFWATSIAIADGIEDESDYTAAFMIISENLAIGGHYENALAAADKINNSFYKAGSMINTANLLIIEEKFGLADSTLQKALKTCENIDNLLDKASAMSAISASYKLREDEVMSKEIDDQKEKLMSEARKNFNLADLEPDRISEIIEDVELTIEAAMIHADISEFTQALNLVLNYDSAAAAAAAISYIALCADIVEFETTDELVEALDKIQQKQF
ncbi:hypothetical protein KKB99_07850, partial [bacterium]|nr:hypothetical protein [bacterium]MBU1025905.1 hypothetical protein [bacterium]